MNTPTRVLAGRIGDKWHAIDAGYNEYGQVVQRHVCGSQAELAEWAAPKIEAGAIELVWVRA